MLRWYSVIWKKGSIELASEQRLGMHVQLAKSPRGLTLVPVKNEAKKW